MKYARPWIVLCALACTVVATPVFAHSDTVLRLEDGIIKGLPKEFQPAKFDREKKSLEIAGKELEFPRVLRDLFPDDHMDNDGFWPRKVNWIRPKRTASGPANYKLNCPGLRQIEC